MEKQENGLKALFLLGKRWSTYSPRDGEKKEIMGIHSQSLMLSRRNLMKVLLNSSEDLINCTIVFQWRVSPPPAGAKITFAACFESYFGFTLRERRSITIDQIQTVALEIESNLVVGGKTSDT